MNELPKLGHMVAPPGVDQEAVLGGYVDMAGTVVIVLSDDEAGLAARRWFATNPAWLLTDSRPIGKFEFRTPVDG